MKDILNRILTELERMDFWPDSFYGSPSIDTDVNPDGEYVRYDDLKDLIETILKENQNV